MQPKFFGQYLKDKHLISRKQLTQAVDYQGRKISKLGEIGIEKGYLTEQQASEINYCQRRLDIKFGEFAVAMRYLTDKQLEELLDIQKDNHIFLGEAMVRLGFLDFQKKERELEFYHKEQQPFMGLNTVINKNVGDTDKIFAVLDTTIKTFRRVANLHSKIGFLSSECSVLKNLYITTIVQFYGVYDFKFFLNLPYEVALAITDSISEHSTKEIGENDIVRSIEEFAEIICWVVKAELLEVGKQINISEPKCILKSSEKSYSVSEDEEVLEFPSITTEGCFSVGLIRKK